MRITLTHFLICLGLGFSAQNLRAIGPLDFSTCFQDRSAALNKEETEKQGGKNSHKAFTHPLTMGIFTVRDNKQVTISPIVTECSNVIGMGSCSVAKEFNNCLNNYIPKTIQPKVNACKNALKTKPGTFPLRNYTDAEKNEICKIEVGYLNLWEKEKQNSKGYFACFKEIDKCDDADITPGDLNLNPSDDSNTDSPPSSNAGGATGGGSSSSSSSSTASSPSGTSRYASPRAPGSGSAAANPTDTNNPSIVLPPLAKVVGFGTGERRLGYGTSRVSAAESPSGGGRKLNTATSTPTPGSNSASQSKKPPLGTCSPTRKSNSSADTAASENVSNLASLPYFLGGRTLHVASVSFRGYTSATKPPIGPQGALMPHARLEENKLHRVSLVIFCGGYEKVFLGGTAGVRVVTDEVKSVLSADNIVSCQNNISANVLVEFYGVGSSFDRVLELQGIPGASQESQYGPLTCTHRIRVTRDKEEFSSYVQSLATVSATN